MTCDVVVAGGGAFARGVAMAVGRRLPSGARLTFLVRAEAQAAELAYLGGAGAALEGGRVKVTARTVDLTNMKALEGALRGLRPAVIVCCASLQSPQEQAQRPSAWTDVVSRAGFGATLPLQTVVAGVVAEAAASAAPDAVVVNACLPDAVNPVLRGLGLPVACGIGNVATIAASLQAALGLPGQEHLQVVAHHVHLHAPTAQEEEALAWHDGYPIPNVTELLSAQRASSRPEVNAVGAEAAGMVLAALATGERLRTNLPGPNGLPGGYPVVLHGGRVTVALPEGVPIEAAVERHRGAGLREGVAVATAGTATFAPSCIEALGRWLPEIAEPVAAADMPGVAARLTQVRSDLRRLPACA